MPEMDAWTISNTLVLDPSGGRVQQLGVNLGAPGDRRDPHGLMWLEYPAVAGDAPNLGLEFTGDYAFFQDHPTSMAGTALPWVTSSGVEKMTSLRLSLKAQPLYMLKTGIPIDHADDDAKESTSGAVNLDSSTLELVQNAAEQQLIGLRFNSINLARGAEVRSALLQLTSRTASDEPTELVIRAEASGNAARFTTKSGDISTRSLTQSEVRWSPDAWKPGESGESQGTPDLSPLIREVINREDWQPSNSIVFIISGKGNRNATAFRGRDSTPAKLIVDAEVVTPDQRTEAPAEPYRVRLHFGSPQRTIDEERVFDVTVQGQSVIENIKLGDKSGPVTMHTIDRVMLGDWLEIKFTEKTGHSVLSGIELQRLEE